MAISPVAHRAEGQRTPVYVSCRCLSGAGVQCKSKKIKQRARPSGAAAAKRVAAR
jgi:hypothetical protein